MAILNFMRAVAPAARHLFAALGEFDTLPLPNIHDFVGEDGVVRMTATENEHFMNQVEEFMELDQARSIIAGSILQVAYTAIHLHSTNQKVPRLSLNIGVKEGHKAVPFCIGRMIHNVPIGLIVYAGRIQYNHWHEGEPWNPVAREVLRQLYLIHSKNPLFDLAYDLEFPAPKAVSHYIVRLELGWHGYDEFEIDLMEMLT